MILERARLLDPVAARKHILGEWKAGRLYVENVPANTGN